MERSKSRKNNMLFLFICAVQVFIYCGGNVFAEATPDKSRTEEAKRAVRLMNFTLAAKLFSNLAESGDRDAQYRLGVLYQTGRGVTKDYTKALYFFKRAAEKGYPKALYSLAQMFENGWGTNLDHQQALSLYQQAADRGYAQEMILQQLLVFLMYDMELVFQS